MKIILEDEERIYLKSGLLSIIAITGYIISDSLGVIWFQLPAMLGTLYLCFFLSLKFYKNKGE